MTIMRDIFASERLSELLFTLLDEYHPRDRLYVYRVVDGAPVRPALIKGWPFSDLLEHLRDDHGGGEFRIMIRRGDKMMLSGTISIAPPPAC
jgi:hypothetical protein